MHTDYEHAQTFFSRVASGLFGAGLFNTVVNNIFDLPADMVQ
jgi:hypothetical protein